MKFENMNEYGNKTAYLTLSPEGEDDEKFIKDLEKNLTDDGERLGHSQYGEFFCKWDFSKNRELKLQYNREGWR